VVAKGDRGMMVPWSPRPQSYAERHLQQAHHRIGRQHTPVRRLAAPDASATAHSKLCGSTVKADLKMDGSVVTIRPMT